MTERVPERLLDSYPLCNYGWSSIKDFELLKVLGQGTYGIAFLGVEKKTHKKYVLKGISKAKTGSHKVLELSIYREIAIQINLCHPNVVRLYGYVEDDSFFYLIMEHIVNGALSQVLQKVHYFDEGVASTIIASLARTLSYLHGRSLTHRDMKPANILVSAKGELLLSDFGSVGYVFSPRDTHWGTPYYMSPEMLFAEGHTASTDMWSLGVICFEIVYGHYPFVGKDAPELRNNIRDGTLLFPHHPRVSDDAKDIIRKMLEIDRSIRLTSDEVLQHPWIVRNANSSGIINL